MQDLDHVQFEREWTKLGVNICQAIYSDPKTQELKKALKEKGYLTLEEKSQFIDISDQIKYRMIYEAYGEEGSEGYGKFVKDWNNWFQTKGVSSTDHRGQRNSVDHILFGSTPDPEEFLLNFEHEIPATAD